MRKRGLRLPLNRPNLRFAFGSFTQERDTAALTICSSSVIHQFSKRERHEFRRTDDYSGVQTMRTIDSKLCIITLDYAMYLKPSGGVRDHGYLFRTTREKMEHIFPIERVYDLSLIS